ncbi:hypothetical protein OD350_28960 (plasmid) [Clostridium beijerinckii]|uniref:hypothetical protein n=1 Tax=Clostridium beijerinckii TaxID=1520 RepID=UPI002225D006|nr:hypothetical protein [Clostridium beijerinckii]UYZ39105.1 hypothetical protein OD350_28960 [Clostridium beijerinckii]
MSDSILTDIAILILIVLLVFHGPIYQNFETADKLSDSITKEVVNKYQKDIRKSGYIDQKTYLHLLNDLCVTGRVYDVKLTHTSRLAYPNGNGDYEVHEIKYGEDIILDTIKDGTIKYTMRYGDDFKIDVKETSVAPSRYLSSIFSGRAREVLITFGYGGMVENEVTE